MLASALSARPRLSQQFVDPGVVVLDAEVAGLDAQRLAHGEERIEHQFLRHHAELPARLARSRPARRSPCTLTWPDVGARQAGQDADQGGLAGAIGSEQAEELALLDVEAHAVQGLERAAAGGRVESWRRTGRRSRAWGAHDFNGHALPRRCREGSAACRRRPAAARPRRTGSASSRSRAGMRLTEKLLPSASASRRHSSSTASADESKRSRARRVGHHRRLRLASAAPAPACGSRPRPASCVSSAGRTSMRQLSPSCALDLLRSVKRGDQAVDALGVDLLRELAAVGLHQPHAQHVQVVDLPAGALARRLLEPVVQLDRVAAAADFGAHHHVGVVGRAALRLEADRLVVDLRERARSRCAPAGS